MADSRDQHVDAITIADLDAGLLDPGPAREVVTHLDSCVDCRGVREDLAELSTQLAGAPVPPMPTDVAIRIDAALRRAAEQRDEGTGDTAESRVIPLASRRRRWLAPLMAAASAVVGLAVVGQVVNNQSGGDGAASTAGGGSDAAESEPEAATGGRQDLTQRPDPLQLSIQNFRSDVLDQVYGGAPDAAALRDAYESLARKRALTRLGCATDGAPEAMVPNATHRRAFLDGEPAVLILSGPRSNRSAVAVICQDGRPYVAASARLRLE